RLVEMGRNPPQKRFKLPEQFRGNCGIMHGVAFPVWLLALRIIAKIELERRLSFPKIGAKPCRPPQRFASQEKNGEPPQNLLPVAHSARV
ncbi:MAG: hypothetical protein Q4G55_13670, partial [bacterium]|nr:hypothetical protein [bacterium]